MRLSRLAAIGCAAALGCFPFDGGEHHLDGPYYLRATDVPEQMALYHRVGSDGGVERVPSTVFAAGWDARHLIAKRHPGGNRSVTEYYILERAKDTARREPAASVAGPFTEEEFAAARRRLGVASTLDFSMLLHELQ